MSAPPDLAPPGSSTYSSNTLQVGDGTWDRGRNSFLLPNLMGVNFQTMRYNGMGNRFRDMPQYHSLIRAHGVIAAIVFLGLVPGAILIARFYGPSPYRARRYHMWMQSVTVLLSTVVFVLGWFAVGPQRSLTNPHHGIGLAIYVLIMFQMFWGWFVHKRLKDRQRPHIPLKLMLHHWIGRATALLGIAQIPLGLTLYGSPLSLFILYAVTVFMLLLIYFILTFLHERRLAADYYSRGSYSSGPEVVDDRHGGGHLGRTAAAGAAAGLFASRFRRRSRSRSPTGDYSEDASYVHEKEKTGWGKRLVQMGALVGLAALGKKFFDRRRDRESDTESGRYEPAHTITDSADYSISHVEEGRRPPTGAPRRYDGPPSPEHSRYTESEFTQPERRTGGGLRNALLGAGALAGAWNFIKNRRNKKDERRSEDLRHAEMHDPRITGGATRRYTGDGRGPRRERGHSPVSDVTGPTDPLPAHTRPAVPLTDDERSGNDTVRSIGRHPRRHPSITATGPSSHRRRSNGREESVDSQPVSIKVRMHDHGRRVTLRRLTREEASASRDARRRDRNRRSSRIRREGSLSGNEGDDHWRRVEERERQQAEELARAATPDPAVGPAPIVPEHAGIPPPVVPPPVSPIGSPAPPLSPLPPPPIPGGPGGIHSPISTDISSYASRSGRRRAERRAQTRGGGHSVEFT